MPKLEIVCFTLAGLPNVPSLGLVWPWPAMPALPWPGPATTTAAAAPEGRGRRPRLCFLALFGPAS